MSATLAYTSNLGAGLGLIAETGALLEIWQPGMSIHQLHQEALDSGRFSQMTARRLRNLVVEAFAPSGQEPSHRRVRAEGPEELDEGRTGTEEDLFHSLILDHLTVHRFDPQRCPILGDGGGQIADRDPDVVDVEQNLVGAHAVTASAFDGPLPAPAGAG